MGQESRNYLKGVPLFSVADMSSPEKRRMIDDACREWGFFQIVDHGIDADLIDQIRTQMRFFFSRPMRFKKQYERSQHNPWGFYDSELTKNVRDWKQIYDYGPGFLDQQGQWAGARWPDDMPAFRRSVLDYYQNCETLAREVLTVLANNLHTDADELLNNFSGAHTSFLRMNYYPACPSSETPVGPWEPVDGYLGLNRHTDAGALTLLLQDEQPGLQVFNAGGWHLVEPVAGAITVNIGDIVQVWSNDRYRAALHRVVANPLQERFSIPFFYNPRAEVNYAPLPGMLSSERPAVYRRINWGEFRALRVAGDYTDVGEEIQISHYRVQDGSGNRGKKHGFC